MISLKKKKSTIKNNKTCKIDQTTLQQEKHNFEKQEVHFYLRTGECSMIFKVKLSVPVSQYCHFLSSFSLHIPQSTVLRPSSSSKCASMI